MKYPKLSALFGAAMSWLQGGADGKGSLTAEQQASLEASEKKIGEMEADLTQAKADNEAHTKKIGELEAQVTGLNGQVTTLTNEKNTLVTEKAELQKKLDEKPTGTATTIVPGEGKEASQAADPGAPKAENKYATSVDAEVAAMKKAQEQLTIK